MVPETLTELLDCKDDSPQEDVEVERGHMDWERTEVGHVDKTNLSCRRTLDLSPEGDQRKTSSAYPHKVPSARKEIISRCCLKNINSSDHIVNSLPPQTWHT